MSLLTSIALWVSGMALLLSIGACVATALLLLRYPSTSAGKLSARLMEIEQLLETLSLAVRNLKSRLNMQDRRAREASVDQPSTETDPETAKAAARAELTRKLKPFSPFRS
jgi:hypothetical protein